MKVEVEEEVEKGEERKVDEKEIGDGGGTGSQVNEGQGTGH